MGDPQVTPEQLKEIAEGFDSIWKLINRILKKDDQLLKKAIKGIKSRNKVLSAAKRILSLKVYVYEQKVPKDGHGPLVIIDEKRELADAQFLNEFQKMWPKASAVVALDLLKNAEVTVKPYRPSIILNLHGI